MQVGSLNDDGMESFNCTTQPTLSTNISLEKFLISKNQEDASCSQNMSWVYHDLTSAKQQKIEQFSSYQTPSLD